MDEGWLGCLTSSFIILITLGLIFVLKMFVPLWAAIILGIAISILGLFLLYIIYPAFEEHKKKSMRRKTHRRFVEKYASQGKDIFMCCEAGSEPEEYMKNNWLPKFKDRTVFYDRSGHEINTLESDICLYCDAITNRPLVILFPREGSAKYFNFRKAYVGFDPPTIADITLFQSMEKDMFETLGVKL